MRKTPETLKFQVFGSFETLGSKLSHGTSKKVADVRTHLKEVSKRLYLKKPEKAFSFCRKCTNILTLAEWKCYNGVKGVR